ncbi:acyl carrier protein phosphodiesterase [Adhaeribacter pallidiroseus]|uniref:[Acyl-carrier-protein] phosphodiesterase n=1 Tax=Adhaeribacter pallidiroseus TaxID=2072847 RepID=A0A369QLT0_9BACT|nr:ACP phosphodiesterase [Adhaeribacter pallidiroseus]RDC63208.1 [Acyl-carrier-protein] phosphodiesterase [Adhaeribacter pallidiroseus]
MNFLAHAYLSGSDEELLVGNFIADSVKGRQKDAYPVGIRKGIELHRLIDTFTDTHAIVKQTKERLRPEYGKFAGVITDMFYDHFLAANFNQFATMPLLHFTEYVYTTVQKYATYLPTEVQYFLPYMIKHNWLYRYAQVSGIKSSLEGLSRRSTFVSNMATATQALELHYPEYQQDFYQFFPDLQTYVKQSLDLDGSHATNKANQVPS